MKNNDKNPVPEQLIGSSIDVVEKRSFSDLEDARTQFATSVNKLFSVNKWGDYAGVSAFQLTDEDGDKLDRGALEGDYIRIDIPGPGLLTGEGYDWVRIESISNVDRDDEQFVAMRVRPANCPISNIRDTAHFLKAEATSTFIIRRSGTTVFAEEHGRNESANTDVASVIDKGRNLIVGVGAKIGLSYPQWKSLVKAFLTK